MPGMHCGSFLSDLGSSESCAQSHGGHNPNLLKRKMTRTPWNHWHFGYLMFGLNSCIPSSSSSPTNCVPFFFRASRDTPNFDRYIGAVQRSAEQTQCVTLLTARPTEHFARAGWNFPRFVVTDSNHTQIRMFFNSCSDINVWLGTWWRHIHSHFKILTVAMPG